jgi:uncharacterized protein
MPVTLTYPGVYIEEVPSGVRTITGVATSITAFMGQALRGPVDRPILINSFADYQRIFGGLSKDSTMSYAVKDFYMNGGSRAVIVRLYKDPAGEVSSTSTITVGELELKAANPGDWGKNLAARIERTGITKEVADRYGLKEEDLFNLEVIERGPDGRPVAREHFLNLSDNSEAGSRRIDRVLEQESQMVRSPWKEEEEGEEEEGGEGTEGGEEGTEGGEVGGEGTGAEGAAAAVYTNAVGGAASADLADDNYTSGFNLLDQADLFNILCIPPDKREGITSKEIYSAAMTYCVQRRAMLIVDPPLSWGKGKTEFLSTAPQKLTSDIGLGGVEARNVALYFPRVIQADPLRENQLDTFVACGMIAGVMARTDVQRGVWKAPAGVDAALNGIQGLQVNLTDDENGTLNQLGINCLRSFPIIGPVVWGARTLRGADQLADEYKYVPVRRLALFIEESLFRGTKWVVFEPNDEPLWAQIRLNVGAFMHNLFRQGAFQGSSARDAYLVKCDSETTTPNDINLGIVNIVVGFAPLKPAEFVIIKIQQLAGQVEA